MGDGSLTVTADEGLKSAGLFTPEGKLVHYLFQGLPLKKGTYRYVLPTSDLFGRPIPAGNYEIRMTESTVGWVYRGMVCNAGVNTTPETTDSVHVGRMAFTPEGMLLTASGWSERHINLRLGDPATGRPKWTFEGSADCTGLCLDSGGMAYLVRNFGEKSVNIFRIDTATGVPFARPDGSLFVNVRGKFQSNYLGGIAELGGKLYAADTDADKVWFDSVDSLKFDASATVSKPLSPSADRKRNLVWLVSNRQKIVALAPDGRVAHEFTGVKTPLSLSVAGDRMAILAAEVGKILIFDISRPAQPVLVRTLGRGDGPYGPWLPDRFQFQAHERNLDYIYSAVALHENGSVALRDASARVVTFGPDGRVLHDGFAQWGGDTYFAPFTGDKLLRAFDSNACVSYFLDPKTGKWQPDTYWGLPPMHQRSPRGFFSAGGKNFGVFTYQSAAKNGEERLMIASYDQPLVRPVAIYQRNPAGGWLMVRDTNGDGRIDAQDGPGKPVLDVEGKPVQWPLWSRFTYVNPDGTIHHTVRRSSCDGSSGESTARACPFTSSRRTRS